MARSEAALGHLQATLDQHVHQVTEQFSRAARSEDVLVHVRTMLDLHIPNHLASVSRDLHTISDQLTARAAKTDTAASASQHREEDLQHEIIRLSEELARLRQISIEQSSSLNEKLVRLRQISIEQSHSLA